MPINGTILDREGLLAKVAPLLEMVIPVVPAGMAGLAHNDIAKGGDEKAYPMVPTKAANSVLRELARIRAGLARITSPRSSPTHPRTTAFRPRTRRPWCA